MAATLEGKAVLVTGGGVGDRARDRAGASAARARGS